MKKVWNIASTVLVWFMVVVAVGMMIFTIISVNTFNRNDRDIFGYKAYIVLSDSMSATDFSAGDLVLVREVDPATLHPTPKRIGYPKGAIRYRHYGRCVEEMLKKACEMPEGEERNELMRLIAAQMKKEYILWNKDNVEDERIVEDICEYTNGLICPRAEDLNLGVYRAPTQQFSKNQHGKNQRKKNKKK